MARPSIRTEEMIEEILDRFSVGETITSVCLDAHLPTIRALQKWRRKDKELDDACFNAEKRGILVIMAEAVDAQRSVINGTCTSKYPQAVVTAANNMGHQALARLTKLDIRFKDKQEVHHTGPMIFGWENEGANEVEDDEVSDDVTVKAGGVMPDAYLDIITPEDVAN
jgi:hypothetical protein